jgi:hypothetical protein
MYQAREWRVSPRLTAAKIAGALIFTLAALIGDPVQMLLVGAGAVALALHALRDLLVRVRLSADSAGITVVTGFARRRCLPWSQIERIRVDERARLGLRSQLLEIDTGDNLHFLSAYELSAPCADVADELVALRTGGRQAGPD